MFFPPTCADAICIKRKENDMTINFFKTMLQSKTVLPHFQIISFSNFQINTASQSFQTGS